MSSFDWKKNIDNPIEDGLIKQLQPPEYFLQQM